MKTDVWENLSRFEMELVRSSLPRDMKEPIIRRLNDAIVLFFAMMNRKGMPVPPIEGLEVQMGCETEPTYRMAHRWLRIWDEVKHRCGEAEFTEYWAEQCEPIEKEVRRIADGMDTPRPPTPRPRLF